MERLNDIFKRDAQHPRTPSRRPLPEQTARIGEYARAYQAERSRPQLPQPAQPPAPAAQSIRPQPGQRPLYGAARPQGNNQPGRPTYQGDTHQAATTADVQQYTRQEEWDDEEAASMRYGDWESDIYDMPAQAQEQEARPSMSRGAMRIAQAYPQSSHSLVTRELRRPGDDVENTLPAPPQFPPAARQPAPRIPHSPLAQSYPPRPAASPLPLSQQRTISRTQRVTQPLNRPPKTEPQPIPAPYSQPRTPCPICKGKGYLRADVPYGHPNFGKPIACECKEQERRERRRLELETISNLGELKDKSFENFKLINVSPGVQIAYQVARQYAEDPDGWLIFIGRVGCGKTHLAAAIANRRLAGGSRVLFSTVSDLLDHLRATFSPNATEVYDHLFQEMREAEVLVLDDLGAHHSSAWANEKLFQLLNYRYNSCFPTIITANNTGLQGIDDRICSRIMDTSLVTRITFDQADDYRLRNPKRE